MNDFLRRVLRRRTPSGCRLAFVGAVVLVFGTSSVFGAESVTLGFEGEIVEIRKSGNPLFDLPADIAIGRPASLELTFEPIPFPKAARTIGSFIAPGGNTSLRPLGLKLTLNEIVLSDDAATLFMDHDPFASSTAGSPARISERELLYTRGAGSLPFRNDILWNTDGGFANQGSVFDGGEDISDPEIWDLLPLRTITARFDGPGDGLIKVTIAFGDAAVVPEPSTATCALLIVFTIAALRQASRRRLGPLETDSRPRLHSRNASPRPLGGCHPPHSLRKPDRIFQPKPRVCVRSARSFAVERHMNSATESKTEDAAH